MTELERFCAFCERFLTAEDGGSLVIEDFQRKILSDFFDGLEVGAREHHLGARRNPC